ncbi:DUF1236 domain-containing protein [Microvirga roseola]|uniref:DUF1236 domain-containing protein n=1 Tax=Microvirga roseola TaxID=2883126 RepID=UPI001E28F0D5|nr:DUF1236 domain-containing protein [Microvirga roseola]
MSAPGLEALSMHRPDGRMNVVLRSGLLASALLVLPGLSAAQAQAPQAGAPQNAASDWEQLPPDKQDRIRSFVEMQNLKPVISGDRVEVGSRLQPNVPLRGLPRDMVTEIPKVTSYLYVVLPEGIAIVEPNTRRVVQIIER